MSGANPCEPSFGEIIVLVFALSLAVDVREGYNVFATRTIGVFSGTSVVLALVVVPVITVPGTCSVVFVIFTADVAGITVSGVLLKVVLLLGGGTFPEWTFLFIRKSLVLVLSFLFVEMLNSGLPDFRSSSSEHSLSHFSSSLLSKTMVVFESI